MASTVVSAVVMRLAGEFPDLPLGSVIAVTARSLRELRRVSLTALLDAPVDDVLQLVEEQARHAIRNSDVLRVPRQVPGQRAEVGPTADSGAAGGVELSA